MAETFKNLIISLTPELEEQLGKVKEQQYNDETQTEMIRDLIIRGLDAQKKNNIKKEE